MVKFAGQNPVAASMPRQEYHLASGEFAGKQSVGWRAEGCFDLHPLLVRETFDAIKSRAADDADAMS